MTKGIVLGDKGPLVVHSDYSWELKAGGFAASNHTHPECALAEHVHVGYADAVHAHDYAATIHGHAIGDTTGLQAALDGKSATSHDHAGVYAEAIHNHDASYAATGHDHAGVYSPVGHTHPGGSEAFPVGSVFIAVVSANPGTLLGYGTWAAFAAGRMLVGLNAIDADFDAAEETGGAKTHTLTATELPAHTHSVTDPGHAHGLQRYPTATGGSSGFTADTSMSGTPAAITLPMASATTGITIGSTGSGGAVNHMPPYIVCYMWKRTA